MEKISWTEHREVRALILTIGKRQRMDLEHDERRLNTKNSHQRNNGVEADKRKTRSYDTGLFDYKWILKA